MNGRTLWNQDYRGVNRKPRVRRRRLWRPRGQITDVQQPGCGQQVMDMLLPF